MPSNDTKTATSLSRLKDALIKAAVPRKLSAGSQTSEPTMKSISVQTEMALIAQPVAQAVEEMKEVGEMPGPLFQILISEGPENTPRWLQAPEPDVIEC